MENFILDKAEAMTLDCHGRLSEMYVLSPFVWQEPGEERYHLMLRAVPKRDDEPRLKMAEIFYGVSDDGLHFVMDDGPVIFPGADIADRDGCEDPTVVVSDGQVNVWYTGWNQAELTGRLLMASGRDCRSLKKRGMALDSVPDFVNPKEATVVRDQTGEWRLLFEYARNEASCIGIAESAHPEGPWTSRDTMLVARPDRWDNWHLSTGPIIRADSDEPIMFYNGASRDAHWRIGWAAFNRDYSKIVGRGDDPVITPKDLQDGWTDIAFAASAIEHADEVWLYYSVADQQLQRAKLRFA